MIFLAGPHGAGKTESARIMSCFSFLPIDLGPTLRKIHLELGIVDGFKDWIRKGEADFGQSFTDNLLIAEIRKIKEVVENGDSHVDIVVVGSRSRRGIEKIKGAVPRVRGRDGQVIFIEAPFDVLHKRYNERERLNLDPASFRGLLGADLEIGIESIREIADFTLFNNGDIKSLETAIREILFQKLGYAQ
ncbi:MAG: hypothetical protein WAP55_03620 [Minisyncoccia bacterium]